MSSRDATLAFLLALIVLGRWSRLKKELRQAAAEGISRETLDEVLLQSHLFAGYPRTIEAFETLESVAATGVFSPAKKPTAEKKSGRENRGRKLFDRIYASQSQGVLDRISEFHPHLGKWIIEHAYGRVLSRPQLSPKQRELAAVAALIVSRQWRQLVSHLRGAKRCGAKKSEIFSTIKRLKPITPPSTLRKAMRMAEKV